MKILRAIGGFFAKIGRWIANTAWIQPLLIVGGIFGVIFSIPYIKTAIENSQVDTTDYDYAYYTASSRALDLKENSTAKRSADKLFSNLELNNAEGYKTINDNFGKKFFVTFIKKDCASCKECVEGWKEYAKMNKDFKLYTIVMDKKAKSSDKDYLSKRIFNTYNQFFGSLDTTFGEEDKGEYALYKNVDSSVKSTYVTNLNKFADNTTSSVGEGIETPFTFMYDFDKIESEADYVNTYKVTAVMFNYVSLIEGTSNIYTKKLLLDDAWNYKGVFNPNPEEIDG